LSRLELKTGQYAEVLLPQNIGKNMEVLTYSVPPDLPVKIGTLVEVPLRNKTAKGIIFRFSNNHPAFKTKPINKIVENAPHLQSWQVELMKYISDYYFCPLFKCLKLFLPVNIIKNKKISGAVYLDDQTTTAQTNNTLTQNQAKVIERFLASDKQITLLHGITGSGKTEIYIRIAAEQITKGNQVLMLVPEIALTPQTLNRFNNVFPNQSALIHSKLTSKEKKDQWLKIAKGEPKIIIGSRSALFAPFNKLGLIIMDEEHEPSFKQDQSPRYNTIDIAKKIAEFLKIKILLGSATPSLESYHLAINGNYGLLELNERVQFNGGTALPSTTVIDLREEIKKSNYSIFSDVLRYKLDQILQKREQSILFINRRGAASAVICRECGYIVKCSHCEVSMTYHKKISVENGTYNAERLICHHCGKIAKVPVTCPKCESHMIRYIGLGTQKVEDEINKAFPRARTIRADSDTVQKKDDFKNIYHAFKNHEADILIGTQMIGKGLHLPKVNLVGVMLADLSLTIPDFRSHERTFQLITQVAGRAGRENLTGEVVIQTYMPDNYAIQMASRHDFKSFYEKEILIRKKMGYPPFSKMIKITVKDFNEKKCIQKSENIFTQLKNLNETEPEFKDAKMEITHYPAMISKLRGRYRWNVLIKGQRPEILLKKIAPHLDNPDIAIDIDPISIN
jgi:primosomal protein N' (replication factor Y)